MSPNQKHSKKIILYTIKDAKLLFYGLLHILLFYILSNYFKSGDHSTDYWRRCNYPNNSLPFDLANIIAKWTSQPTGFKDMIIFAYIVFGKDERNDIVNKRFY